MKLSSSSSTCYEDVLWINNLKNVTFFADGTISIGTQMHISVQNLMTVLNDNNPGWTKSCGFTSNTD